MITTTNSATAALAGSSSTAAAGSTKNAAGSEDRFLKLLVAQLSNQDPMNPMDNAQMTSQMAQISTVTGVQQVNKTIEGLSAQLASMQMLQSSSLVGRAVLVDGAKLPVSGGKAAGAIDLVAAADSVKVEILSAGGQVIDTVDLGAVAAGRQTFEWDAKGRMTEGSVSYRVNASQAGKAVVATQMARATVNGISSDSGVMNVQLQGLGNVTYDKVRAIH
jgi:flagellar basal-body rod modification protein FlgD